MARGDEASAAEEILYSEEVLEELAAIEHDRWAHWQDYLQNLCEPQADGSLRIPSHLVERWTRLIETPYSDLTDEERESDREQVLRYLPTILRALS